jgi:hypothetical protein
MRAARQWAVYILWLALAAPIHLWIVSLQHLGVLVGEASVWLVDLAAALAGWPPARVLLGRAARQAVRAATHEFRPSSWSSA